MEEKSKENEIKEGEQDNLVSELAACIKLRDEYLDGWKRAKADFLNYKKEEASRLEALMKFGNEQLVRELLGVLDSFDLSLTVIHEESARKGIHLVRNQLEDILRKQGLEKIIVERGAAFDPSLHEAVGEHKSEYPPGTVSEEIERGYLLHGKVLRPSRVYLSKGQPK